MRHHFTPSQILVKIWKMTNVAKDVETLEPLALFMGGKLV